MGAFLSVDDTRGLIYIHYEGVVTDEVLLQRDQQVLEWNASHGYHASITDFSEIAGLNISASAIRKLAERPPLSNSELPRVAVIVASDDFVFGMSRMFEMMGVGRSDRIHVVRTLEEAYAQLGVDSLELRAEVEW